MRVADVVFSEGAEDDLFALYLHLSDAYGALGEPDAEASIRAERRVFSVRRAVSDLLFRSPRIGARRDDLMPGLRFVPVARATAYFVAPEDGPVTVLAVFTGGQDHHAHMLARLSG